MYQAILEVDKVTYDSMMKDMGLFVGYDYCTVYNALQVRRCFRCNELNHTSARCTKHISCPRCSLDHDVKSCVATTLKCINCVRENQSKNSTISTEHAAWDTRCPTYINCLEKLKQDFLISK